jgi:molecular chaperone DnaJ
VPISFVQAILGDEIEVPTLEGKTKIKIPSGTQSGQTLRLKEKGVPSLNGRGKGDLFIKVQVEVPMRLNSKQRELLEEFAKVSEADSSSRVGRFFDKLQEFFGQ